MPELTKQDPYEGIMPSREGDRLASLRALEAGHAPTAYETWQRYSGPLTFAEWCNTGTGAGLNWQSKIEKMVGAPRTMSLRVRDLDDPDPPQAPSPKAMTKPTDKELDDRVGYRAPKPTPEAIAAHGVVNGHVSTAMEAIRDVCPDTRELSLAMTKLEEAMFWANAAIARNHDRLELLDEPSGQ